MRDYLLDERPLIHLNSPFIAMVLISWPSGVRFEVQCAGTFCYQKRLEGICIPFDDEGTIGAQLGKLHLICCDTPLSEADADTIDAILQFKPLEYIYPGLPIGVDRARLAESCEAWVPVNILPRDDRYDVDLYEDLLPVAFVGHQAILTWMNCD